MGVVKKVFTTPSCNLLLFKIVLYIEGILFIIQERMYKMKKIISLIAWVLILVFSLGLSCGAETVKMTDVDYESELGKSIDKLVSAGVINGIPELDGTFTYRSNNPITRAEFCKMVNKTFGYNMTADNIFSDVNPNQWYYLDVLTAIKYGYIQGYGDGTFGGEDTITREQVCVILDRIVGKTTDKEVVISDTVSSWAEKAVKNIIGLGYMPLEEGNTFRAMQNMTRGEHALTLDDFVTVTNKEETKTEDKKEENKTQTGSTNTGGITIGGSSSGSSSSGGSSSSDPDPVVPPTPQTDPAVEAVIKAISEIGTVTLDKKTAVEEARQAYNALDDTQKSKVTNVSTLTSAETAIADLEKVQEVIDLIEAIGEITLNEPEDKEDAVKEARKAYKELETQAQRGKVTNYNLLLDAEEVVKANKIYSDFKLIITDITDKREQGVIRIQEDGGIFVLYDENGYEVKGGPILQMLLEASVNILPKKDEGFVITSEYVRDTYSDEIDMMKLVLDSMSEEERKAFEHQIGFLNSGVIMSLIDLFDVNINY